MREEFDAELAALRAAPTRSSDPARKLHKPTQAEVAAVAWEQVASDLHDFERLQGSDMRREFRDIERATIAGAGVVVGHGTERPTASDM
ncbi:MAG TPA: hypothetical protein VET30_02250, partial [Pseudoxanthomonas sp.]|nr:hypothetical protein [Pseudoxanthomonas sp.]